MSESDQTGDVKAVAANFALNSSALSNGGLVMGPTKAGKTNILAALELNADYVGEHIVPGAAIDILIPPGGQMAEIKKRVEDIFKFGRLQIDGTDAPTQFEFTLRRTNNAKSSWFSQTPETEQAYKFRVMDGPGGGIWREPVRAQSESKGDEVGKKQFAKSESSVDPKQAMINAAKSSHGLIFCLDAMDEQTFEVFFNDTSDVFQLLVSDKLKRLAIVLTKADKYFSREGKRAEACAKSGLYPPSQRLKQLMGRGIGHMKKVLPRQVDVACCWSSVYGFIPDDGSSNYDPKKDRLLTFEENISHRLLAEKWRPFQLLDPFVFIATGELCNMDRIDLRKLASGL